MMAKESRRSFAPQTRRCTRSRLKNTSFLRRRKTTMNLRRIQLRFWKVLGKNTPASLLRQRICDLLAKDTENPPLPVSIGVAGYPQDADTIGILPYAADRALY